jgi:hypothetical protein
LKNSIAIVVAVLMAVFVFVAVVVVRMLRLDHVMTKSEVHTVAAVVMMHYDCGHD